VLENDAKYLECVKKVEQIDCNIVKDFAIIAIQKYKNKVDKYIEILLASPDNPNKDCSICKHKLYFDRY
jgi:hypothetical protein